MVEEALIVGPFDNSMSFVKSIVVVAVFCRLPIGQPQVTIGFLTQQPSNDKTRDVMGIFGGTVTKNREVS